MKALIRVLHFNGCSSVICLLYIWRRCDHLRKRPAWAHSCSGACYHCVQNVQVKPIKTIIMRDALRESVMNHVDHRLRRDFALRWSSLSYIKPSLAHLPDLK